MAVYLDSSAIVKLVITEPESDALRSFLRRHSAQATCALARVEVVLSVRRYGPKAITEARSQLRELHLSPVDDALLDAAADLALPGLRSLDAIHLAAAMSARRDIDAVVTYDARMIAACSSLGLAVTTPR